MIHGVPRAHDRGVTLEMVVSRLGVASRRHSVFQFSVCPISREPLARLPGGEIVLARQPSVSVEENARGLTVGISLDFSCQGEEG